jgi:nitrite reductase/ring-hydroxylating ferredoxin subunit
VSEVEPSSDSWTPVGGLADVPVGKAIRLSAGNDQVLVYRTDDEVFVLSDTCTHMGAPLHRGIIRASGSLKSVTCAAHGSMFGLADGRVLRGPATRRLPVYDVRVTDGMIEVRARPGQDRSSSSPS